MTQLLNKSIFILFLAGVTLFGSNLSRATADELPATRFENEMGGVGVEEKLDTQVPLELPFKDENGTDIQLGDLFNQERPVILSLNYSSCPMLCKLQLNGLVNCLNEIEGWKAGEEFQVISVSIDPKETVNQAKATEAKYLGLYKRENAYAGWSFLTGEETSISQLADAVGFGYQYRPELGEYAHAAVIILCTPEGKVSRYLYGIEYPTQTVKLSLLEAAEGKIGTTIDQVILYCFQYDSESGTYAAAARKIMTASGVLVLVLMGCLLFPFWFTCWFAIWLKRRKTKANLSSGLSDQPVTDATMTQS